MESVNNEQQRKIKCKYCNKEFITPINNDGGSKNFFCCESCATAYDNENPKYTKCKNCGKEIRIKLKGLSRFYETKSYCNIECNREFLARNPKIRNEKGELKQICITCGCIFYAKSTRKYCDKCTAKTPQYSFCENCGKKFENYKSPQGYYSKTKKYCSDKCMHEASCVRFNKKIVCKKCGKEFDMPTNVAGWKYYVDFCTECKPKPVPKYSTCAWCGKEFENKKNEQGNYTKKKKYCSDECAYNGQIQNTIKTNRLKYGVDFPQQRNDFKEKFRRTMQEKYSVNWACQLKSCIEGNHATISNYNKEFSMILKEKGVPNDLEFFLGDYTYDIVCLESKTVVEINPTYTHNVLGNHFNNFQYDERYEHWHSDRTRNALANGYRCIHVWQWDDWDKVFSLIRPKQKFYARKLKLKDITKQEADPFISKYHIQGTCRNNLVNVGLFDNEKLIQVMTFGKPRYNKNYEWELLRLCTHSDYYVVGGAEKLFKHFIKQYKPQSVISYCDISKFSGDVYTRLGFTLDKVTLPQKIWSKKNEYITDNLLRQQGADRLIGTDDGKGTDNESIMIREGWLPVYDCGQKVYIYKGETNNEINKKEDSSNK